MGARRYRLIAVSPFRSSTRRASVASIAKRAEPLVAVGLTNDGSCSYPLSTLAPGVARGTHVIQPAKRRGQIVDLRQGALTDRLTRAVNVKDDPGIACWIQQASHLLVVSKRATEQIIEKEGAQGFNRRLGQRC